MTVSNRFLSHGVVVELASASAERAAEYRAWLKGTDAPAEGRTHVLMLDLEGADLMDLFGTETALARGVVLAIGGEEGPVSLVRALAGPRFRHLPAGVDRATLNDEIARSAMTRRRGAPMRVLAIGSHPDDVEIACGGTLLRHRDEGDAIMILTLSRGSRGGDPARREEESRAAAAMLGAELRLLDLPDTQIGANGETIRAIEDAVRDFAPTHIYTHSLDDTHQDHRAVHEATLVAARRCANVLGYYSPSAKPTFVATTFSDVTSTMDEKMRLVGCFRTQTDTRANLEEDLLRSTARFWGRFSGYRLVEPFQAIRVTGPTG